MLQTGAPSLPTMQTGVLQRDRACAGWEHEASTLSLGKQDGTGKRQGICEQNQGAGGLSSSPESPGEMQERRKEQMPKGWRKVCGHRGWQDLSPGIFTWQERPTLLGMENNPWHLAPEATWFLTIHHYYPACLTLG